MTIHAAFDRLITEAHAGSTDASEMLGYALTGFLSTIFPEFVLGRHHFKAPDNYRKMFWRNLNGEEVVRVTLLGRGKILFEVYNHRCDVWGGITFATIGTMIDALKKLLADAKELHPQVEREDLHQVPSR